MAFGKHSQHKCPECGRPMEYCEFPVMLALDMEHQVQPPLWLCRHCWRALPARQGVSAVGAHRRAAQGTR